MDLDGQPAWRFCDACFELYFAGDINSKGVCAGRGGGHSAEGFVFYLPHHKPDAAGQQGWLFCQKCSALFFSGNPGEPPLLAGRCPGTGQLHNGDGSWPFVLPHDVPDSEGQSGWTFCNKCCALFFNGAPPPTKGAGGVCPLDGGLHDAVDPQPSFDFVLPHTNFPNPSFSSVFDSAQRAIIVSGRGFEPGGTLLITYSYKVDEGDGVSSFAEATVPINTDSSGQLVDRVLVETQSDTIIDLSTQAFDTFSGTTVPAT